MSDFKVEVFDMTPVENRGSIKALCRVKLNFGIVVVISDVKVITKRLASYPFVAMPSQYTNEQWRPSVQFLSPEVESAVTSAVLKAWYEMRERRPLTKHEIIMRMMIGGE